jgi:CheY-like chemotaxis protein
VPLAETDNEPGPDVIRVLIVDDEPLIRFVMAEALRDKGATVVEAASADEAWSFLAAGGSVDAVFTDYRMPGSLNGGQLANRIRECYPGLPVMVTSAFASDRAWSGPILPKPYDLLATAKQLIALARRHRLEA